MFSESKYSHLKSKNTFPRRNRSNFYVHTHESRFMLADFYKRDLIKFNEMSDEFKAIGIQSLGIFK